MTIGSVSASTVSTLLGARNSQAVRQAYDTAATSTPATSGDKVSISEAGRSASRAEREIGPDNVEFYQIAPWMADYGFIVSTKLGGKYIDDPTYGIDRSVRAEYSQRIEDITRQLMQDHGIKDTQTHYEKLILDKEFSEMVRQDMLDRVKNDARLVELLPKVGKSFLLD
ncbi:MAG: hypothetical protein H3C26_04725 [Rhodocyclaceae bacterium]|nr:hypothetical protein [Rhodocyclaceae bacterium]